MTAVLIDDEHDALTLPALALSRSSSTVEAWFASSQPGSPGSRVFSATIAAIDFEWGGRDLNPRSLGYEPTALTSLATAPCE